MSTLKEQEAVLCPSCSVQVSFQSLNTHLDRCLGVSQQKRTAPEDAKPDIANRDANHKRIKTSDEAPTKGKESYKNGVTAPVATSSRERLDSVAPLAERLRPKSLEDFVGQEAVVNGPLKALIQRGSIPNAILWGPPGTGKFSL